MRLSTTIASVLVLLETTQCIPFDWSQYFKDIQSPWGIPSFGNPSFPPFQQSQKPQLPQNPQQPQPQPQNPQQPSDNNDGNKEVEFTKLNNFLKNYGADIGTAEKPKLQKTTPASSQAGQFGILGAEKNNEIQGFFDKNAQLLNEMLNNPNKKFNVGSMFNFPLQNAGSIIRMASGVNTNELDQNKVQGKSMQERINSEGGEITLYTLVDIAVDFLSDNKPFYNAVLDVAVAFLKIFPFFLDVVFRIVEKVNPYFKPELLQLVMNFLYNYEKHSPPRWVKITDLLTIFLNKDLNISSRALRNIIALVSKNPV